MNDDFLYLTQTLGRPVNVETFSPADARAWTGRLPESLIGFWVECGIGTWVGGRLQFCRPERYAGLMSEVFGGDRQFIPGQSHLIGFSAFGKLLIWNETFQDMVIDLCYLQARSDSLDPGWQAAAPDVAASALLGNITGRDPYDMHEDVAGTPRMFARCVARYGALDPGECYGLFPALALGGVARLENIRRVRALEHFSMLAGLGRIKLLRYEGANAIPVRELGD